mmetsp:Transcript_13426/g.43777  ORF Transcript_13426/g.43777 Transcript_13426/m.43777 type:complete len:227 (+) Transcript_13426:669-1349(+)
MAIHLPEGEVENRMMPPSRVEKSVRQVPAQLASVVRLPLPLNPSNPSHSTLGLRLHSTSSRVIRVSGAMLNSIQSSPRSSSGHRLCSSATPSITGTKASGEATSTVCIPGQHRQQPIGAQQLSERGYMTERWYKRAGSTESRASRAEACIPPLEPPVELAAPLAGLARPVLRYDGVVGAEPARPAAIRVRLWHTTRTAHKRASHQLAVNVYLLGGFHDKSRRVLSR